MNWIKQFTTPDQVERTGAAAETNRAPSSSEAFYWTACVLLFCLGILLYKLGAAALFEPDEGRNAEVARELLLLGNWAIPHYDFTPYLDKPVFFYWLIAVSYKLFGVTEWSARLPSALSAFGTLTLVYLFARRFYGLWQALWAVLILVTSVGFFAMSRVVIFDMTLTLFITLALLSFAWSQGSDSQTERKVACLIFYAALGIATLVKGAVGIVIPGMVIFFYLLLTREWSLLRRLELPLGIAIFLLITVPWYLWVESRSPGYLRYFFYEEHVVRFLTSHFKRTKPWWFYFPVLAAGFAPWTLFLPAMACEALRSLRNRRGLFLILWAVLPFVFFSVSVSKLPHYILPILPPLALIGGITMEASLREPGKRRWPLWLPALGLLVVAASCVLSLYAPRLFPHQWSELLEAAPVGITWRYALGWTLGMGLASGAIWFRFRTTRQSLYGVTGMAFLLLLIIALPIDSSISQVRSSKMLAEKAEAFIEPGTRLALYNAYLPSLPFYLQSTEPLSVVWSGKGSSILGSAYMAQKRPKPAKGYPKVFFTYKEFEELWRDPNRTVLAFLHRKTLSRFLGARETRSGPLLQVGDVIVMSNRPLSPERSAVKVTTP